MSIMLSPTHSAPLSLSALVEKMRDSKQIQVLLRRRGHNPGIRFSVPLKRSVSEEWEAHSVL